MQRGERSESLERTSQTGTETRSLPDATVVTSVGPSSSSPSGTPVYPQVPRRPSRGRRGPSGPPTGGRPSRMSTCLYVPSRLRVPGATVSLGPS